VVDVVGAVVEVHEGEGVELAAVGLNLVEDVGWDEIEGGAIEGDVFEEEGRGEAVVAELVDHGGADLEALEGTYEVGKTVGLEMFRGNEWERGNRNVTYPFWTFPARCYTRPSESPCSSLPSPAQAAPAHPTRREFLSQRGSGSSQFCPLRVPYCL